MSTESRVDAYATAIFAIAQAEGQLSEVEDELFRFARTFEGNDNLRDALTNPGIAVEQRQAIVEELLGGRALTITNALASLVVLAGRSNELPAIVERFVQLSVESRRHEVAEVRSAMELEPAQIERLAAALSEATGKHVEVKVVVDEKVLGGIVARIGDTVIDGSVRHRIEQLKEQI